VPKSRTRLVEVRATANFEANLAAIESFSTEQEFAQGYDRLLEELGDVVIPNLERFPAMGRPFFAHVPQSVEALAIVGRLRATLARLADAANIREYILRDYVILYALVGDNAYLLSIKHHRQLSFDLGRFWDAAR
jgi:ParE toxin of type II toxin-antitoxin system, parDE